MSEQKYIDYLNNVGMKPCPVKWFDEDFEPAGKLIRRSLERKNLIRVENNKIYLTSESHD